MTSSFYIIVKIKNKEKNCLQDLISSIFASVMNTHFKIEFLDNATETLRAVAHPIRITIIDLLSKNGELSVTEIHEHLDIEQAIASHHLRILKSKNIVKVNRVGKNSYYDLLHADFQKIIEVLIRVS